MAKSLGTETMTYKGHVKNGVIVLDDSNALPNGTRVSVELEPKQTTIEEGKADSAQNTMHEKYKSIIGSIKDLPEDFAAEHDHYIHGTPKRNQG